MSSIMISPSTEGNVYRAKSGNTYVPVSLGFLVGVATEDTGDLSNLGCVPISAASSTSSFTSINPATIHLDGVTDASIALQAEMDRIAALGGGTLKLVSASGIYLNGTATLGSYVTLDLTECPVYFGPFGGLWTQGDLAETPASNDPKLFASIAAGDSTFSIVVSGANVTPSAGLQFILRGQRNSTGQHLWHETGVIFTATNNGAVSGGVKWTIVANTPVQNAYSVRYTGDAYEVATGSGDFSTFTIAAFSAFTGNIAAGSMSATVGDASAFTVGDYLFVNDLENVGNSTGTTDTNVIHNEINRVAGISGNTVTFETALYHAYTTAYSGGITKILPTIGARIIGARVSCKADGDVKAYGFRFKYSINCALVDCELAYATIAGVNYGPYAQGFRVEYSRNCYVGRCRFLGKPDANIYSSGQGYGFVLQGCTDCKFLGNTGHNARHGVLLQGGASGNEIAFGHDEGSRISALDFHGINARNNHIHDYTVTGGPLFSPDSSNKAAIRIGNSSHLYGDFGNTVENITIYNWKFSLGVNDGFGIDLPPMSGTNIVRNITIKGCNYGVYSKYNTTFTTAITGQNLVENVRVYDYDGSVYHIDGGPSGVVQGLQLRNVTSPADYQGGSTENTIYDYAPGNANISAYISGLYYPAIPLVSFSNKTITAGRLYAVGPFTAQQTATITKLGTNVVTGSAVGTHMAIGVYTDSGNFPSALIGGGVALTDSTGVDAEVTGLSIPLIKGAKYWIVANFEGTPVINAAGSTTAFRYPMTTSTGNPAFLVKKTQAYSSSLPAAFPASTVSDFAAESAPHFWFRL